MNITFENKVALVTGAASGLGLATAKAFAESGAAVVLADWNEEAVRAAADGLAARGHKVLAVRCDVSDDAQVEAMVDQTVAAFGRLDAAYNNAGVQNVLAETADSPRDDYYLRWNLGYAWTHRSLVGPVSVHVSVQIAHTPGCTETAPLAQKREAADAADASRAPPPVLRPNPPANLASSHHRRPSPGRRNLRWAAKWTLAAWPTPVTPRWPVERPRRRVGAASRPARPALK